MKQNVFFVEPWPGNIFSNPLLLTPGIADAKILQPVWERLTNCIRNVDSETIIFFEGVLWDIFDGHTSVPGGDGSKAALSYHYYIPAQLEITALMINRKADFKRLETGGMLTEFRMWAAGDDAEGLGGAGASEPSEVPALINLELRIVLEAGLYQNSERFQILVIFKCFLSRQIPTIFHGLGLVIYN